MEKIKKRYSLKWRFMLYLPVFVVVAYLGAAVIGNLSNEVQTWYVQRYSSAHVFSEGYEIVHGEDGNLHAGYYSKPRRVFDTPKKWAGYWAVSYAQAVLIPLWVVACGFLTGFLFYKREVEKPLHILLDASEKISENSLDFHLEETKPNELGSLCVSFEKMREALQRTNQENFRMLEERSRLNAAFSHDMRTPITVLKGYVELLEKYVPDGKLSEEKQMEILGMISGQVARLEHYTGKMGSLQHLEDVEPSCKEIAWEELTDECNRTAELLKGELQLRFTHAADSPAVCVDEELVLEVYENILSNAVRYASSWIRINVVKEKDRMSITVEDDGEGFSREALRNATEPFFREEGKDDSEHFGLGLYICRILCAKCGGELIIENGGKEPMSGGGKVGSRVTAVFREGERQIVDQM